MKNLKTGRYSQLTAMFGIVKASLRSSSRNPSSIIFGLIFPLIFIVVFGYIGGGSPKLTVALKGDDTANNPIAKVLENTTSVTLKTDLTDAQIDEDLQKGKVDALVTVRSSAVQGIPHFDVDVTTTAASPQNGQLVSSIINSVADKTNLAAARVTNPAVSVKTQEVAGRKLSSIDFILPGQLGFSLLTAGVFATAFVFLTLKQTLVIKRFFTTPVSRLSIIMGEGIARLLFALIQGGIIVLVGHYAFHYTLIHGIVTFAEIMVLAAVALIVFLGFGFIISSVAKDERTVPPLAQLVTLPQFLLAGTFFPIESFPSWLQPISKVLPLTFFNDAVRKVAFEGGTLVTVAPQIGYLALWGVGVYIVAVRLFKWE